jgi:hypothetical protein
VPVARVFPERFNFAEMDFPVATRAAEHESVWLDEKVFRAGPRGIDDVIAALRKIQAHAGKMDEVARVAKEKYGWTGH